MAANTASGRLRVGVDSYVTAGMVAELLAQRADANLAALTAHRLKDPLLRSGWRPWYAGSMERGLV